LFSRKIEKAKKIARKMLLKSKPIEEIVEFTVLPYETVAALIQP